MPGSVPIKRVEHGMFVREWPAVGPHGTLLFIHGLGSWGQCFDKILDHPELAGWRKLVPDLPNYGISPWMHEPLSLSALAENLGDWLVARGEQPVVVVGHSLGGVLALILAESFPAKVLAVIDVEGNICSEDCSLSGKAASQPLDHFLESGFEAMADEIYQLAHGEEQLQDFYASMRMCDPRAFHRHAAELVVLSASEKLAGRLGALPVPAFYIAGSPGGAGDRSRGLLEKAGVPCSVISKAGHVPFADQPDDFAKVVASIASEKSLCKERGGEGKDS